MQTVLSILQVNDVLVYFVYGQVFFSLGLAIALHSRGRSRLELAGQLRWLAAFGFAHGLHEWAHVFIPIQAAYLPSPSIALLNAARLALLAVSFFLLGQFGTLVATPTPRLRLVARLAFGALLVVSLAWVLGLVRDPDAVAFVHAETWVRRVLGFPAAALSAFGMLRQARRPEGAGLAGIGRDFQIAAVSFGAYAFLAGLVVLPADPLAAQWPVYRLKLEFLGLPAPVLRSLAGLGVVLGIVRGLRIFEIETDRRLEEAEHARFEASERARSAMESMAVIISEHRDLPRLLEAGLGQILALAGSSAGWLMIAERGTSKVDFHVRRGLESFPAPAVVCPPGERCACRRAMDLGEVVVFPSSDACRLVASWGMDLPAGDAPLSPAPSPTWAGIPLVAHGRPLGVMHLVGGDFGPERLALLASLGRQLGLAVENAQLAQEVARKEAARAQLLRKVIAAQEEERRRVARELHDQTGQSLTATIMTLGAARERTARGSRAVSSMLEEARQVAVQALESTRELILGLRPAALDDLGLVPALRRFAEDLGRKGDLRVDIEAGAVARRLPGDVEIVLFRILQESLHNVLRHSGARRVAIHLASAEGEVHAEVVDDGAGFDLDEATARPETGRGLGLLGMKERAALLGGAVIVETAPGKGTRVAVRIPLVEDSERE